MADDEPNPLEEFLRLLTTHSVTVLNQTPSAFYQLLQALVDQQVEFAPRYVIFGGEALDPTRLAPWFRHGSPDTVLVNMYGITETTVHVTFRRLDEETTRRRSSPIGTTLADLGGYVLDEHLRPVPTVVAGELYVSGAGLSRGPGQKLIPLVASKFLSLRKIGMVDLGRGLVGVTDDGFASQLACQLDDERLVLVGFGAAQAVIEVSQHQSAGTGLANGDQRSDEGDTVGTAGDSHEDGEIAPLRGVEGVSQCGFGKVQ